MDINGVDRRHWGLGCLKMSFLEVNILVRAGFRV